ncbi:hypothetical protein Tco_1145019 [Tanacetum coccineum]
MEPKKVIQALEDPSWIEAMQEELLQLQLQKINELDIAVLTASRPDIDVCCQPKLGLWYPRDSPFDLEAFSDSDYAGASLDRKSTIREYVAAANCCGQVLWIQNQMLDYGFNFMNTKIYIDNESTICIVKNPVFHSKTKHIEIRHHFIRDSYEKKLIQVIKIHTDHNVADLLTKAFDVSSLVDLLNLVADETVYKEWEDRMERAATTASSLDAEQDSDAQTTFETTSKQSNDPPLSRGYTLGSGEDSMKLLELMELCTKLSDLVSKKKREMFTPENEEMEITATIDGKVKVVSKAFIRRHLKLEDSDGISTLPNAEIFEQLALMGPKKTAWEQFSSNIATSIICLATNKTFNFSKLIFEAMVKNLDIESHHTPTSASSTSQPPTSSPSMQTTHAAPMPHDSPILRVHSLRSDEGSLTLNELTVPCTQLSTKVASLEEDLKQTKKVYGNDYTKLILKVKKLEKIVKTGQARRRAKIVVSDNEEDEDDSSKQGRSLIEDMDLDARISLVPPHVADQERIRRGLENVHTFTRRRTVSTSNGLVSTAGMAGVSTTSGLVSTASMAQEVEINIPLPVATKDKELAQKLHEEEQARFNAEQEAKFNEEQEQERLDYEATVRIQEELDELERQRMAQAHQATQHFTNAEWEDILARVAADKDLVQQLQAGEKYSEEDLPRKLVELVNQIKKYFAQQRAEAKRNKPMTPTQQKAYMSTYIKNQEGGYSIKKLKLLYFEQVKEIFETIMRRVQSFVLMDSELEDKRLKRASQEGLEEPAKRQKIREASGSVPEQSNEESKADELSQEQLQQLMIIVLEERMNVKALHTKDDLVKLWSLVHERFNSTKLTDDKVKELWVELKRLFKPDENDTLWKIQRYMHDLLTWKLYDTCDFHHVSTERGHDIFMLVEKDYPLTRALMTLMLCNKLRVDEYSEIANDLLRKIFILANRPRQ